MAGVDSLGVLGYDDVINAWKAGGVYVYSAVCYNTDNVYWLREYTLSMVKTIDTLNYAV